MENKFPMAYALLLGCFLLSGSNPVFADRFEDDCKVPYPCPNPPPVALVPSSIEPHQRAIVVWNGNTERLILSTDLANSPAKLQPRLESLPLPARPVVNKGTLELFTNLAALAASKGKDLSGLIGFSAPGTMDENFDVQEFESLPTLLGYINQSLTQIYSQPSHLDSNTADLHGDYLRRGFHYLAFDRVTVTEEVRTFPPVEYRFASAQGYYPLGDSLSQQDSTQADVVMITPRPVRFSGQPVQLLDAFQATAAELSSIDPDFDWAAFAGNSPVFVQHVQVAGKSSELKQDIFADFK